MSKPQNDRQEMAAERTQGVPGGKPHGRPPVKKGTLGRLLRMLFGFYPILMPLTAFCIIFTSVVGCIPDILIQKVIAIIEKYQAAGDWNSALAELIPLIVLLMVLYGIALFTSFLYTQFMAVITQGFLNKLRCRMFAGMQKLPVNYFYTHKSGDIMSYYTNDIDTIRQLVSQAIPSILRAGVVVLGVFGIMLYYSFWMAALIVVGTFLMVYVSRVVGGGSAKYFLRQQRSVAKAEGFAQEMMNGQKVIKVFNHEAASIEEFDRVNNELFEDAFRAHAYANCLAPIINNIGNILYVLTAVAGGVFLITGANNMSISGMAFSISVIVPFLNMTKQFTGNVNQVSQQVNAIVMGMAGAARVFELIDEKPEEDDGCVTLVNAEISGDGSCTESNQRTGHWAWREPQADGTFRYVPLTGDIRMNMVDFAYVPGKDVLHDITLYARPGQKVAFVGATGAGKTTITNLINRFYDIADGKITYDGININKIRKEDLRRSLGVVLQEVNLFTGTVMENIRYGKLDATDEECIEAAKLANADSFIRMLPQGYQTVLSGDGSGLSQGQRQLISIARAAVADPPVMILDEATSSIDTRTEALVQRGMDSLMKGRTVFVIAHRLSTVKDSDVIMVLEQGRIIERGTHESLLAEKGKYYQLYTGAFELE